MSSSLTHTIAAKKRISARKEQGKHTGLDHSKRAQSARGSKEKRTKCEHCGKLTRILGKESTVLNDEVMAFWRFPADVWKRAQFITWQLEAYMVMRQLWGHIKTSHSGACVAIQSFVGRTTTGTDKQRATRWKGFLNTAMKRKITVSNAAQLPPQFADMVDRKANVGSMMQVMALHPVFPDGDVNRLPSGTPKTSQIARSYMTSRTRSPDFWHWCKQFSEHFHRQPWSSDAVIVSDSMVFAYTYHVALDRACDVTLELKKYLAMPLVRRNYQLVAPLICDYELLGATFGALSLADASAEFVGRVEGGGLYVFKNLTVFSTFMCPPDTCWPWMGEMLEVSVDETLVGAGGHFSY